MHIFKPEFFPEHAQISTGIYSSVRLLNMDSVDRFQNQVYQNILKNAKSEQIEYLNDKVKSLKIPVK
jgi:hypothetical protein